VILSKINRRYPPKRPLPASVLTARRIAYDDSEVSTLT
jgi:hypothetical protein